MSHHTKVLLLGALLGAFVLGGCASGGSAPEPAAPAPAAAPEPEPSIAVFEVTARRLNLRAKPVSGSVVGSLARGDRVSAPAPETDGWLRVETADGQQGWASATYLRPVAPLQAVESNPAPASNLGSASGESATPAAGGKLAQIRPGMSARDVVEILGPPTREGNYITGKSFIPFYYGPDTSRSEFKYAGIGRVVFSRNRWSGGLRVVEVFDDPSETGY
jgi:hypothetical protein